MPHGLGDRVRQPSRSTRSLASASSASRASRSPRPPRALPRGARTRAAPARAAWRRSRRASSPSRGPSRPPGRPFRPPSARRTSAPALALRPSSPPSADSRSSTPSSVWRRVPHGRDGDRRLPPTRPPHDLGRPVPPRPPLAAPRRPRRREASRAPGRARRLRLFAERLCGHLGHRLDRLLLFRHRVAEVPALAGERGLLGPASSRRSRAVASPPRIAAGRLVDRPGGDARLPATSPRRPRRARPRPAGAWRGCRARP